MQAVKSACIFYNFNDGISIILRGIPLFLIIHPPYTLDQFIYIV